MKRKLRLKKKENKLYYLQERRFFIWVDATLEGFKICDANHKDIMDKANYYLIHTGATWL